MIFLLLLYFHDEKLLFRREKRVPFFPSRENSSVFRRVRIKALTPASPFFPPTNNKRTFSFSTPTPSFSLPHRPSSRDFSDSPTTSSSPVWIIAYARVYAGDSNALNLWSFPIKKMVLIIIYSHITWICVTQYKFYDVLKIFHDM